MRQKYSEIISKEEEKEIIEKIMKEYEEKLKKEKEMGILLPSEIEDVECEWETEEELDKWIEENNRKVDEDLKNATVIACEDITREELEKWLKNLRKENPS